jgi:hypothetical protein
VVDIDIDHPGSILEFIQIVGNALGDFTAQGHPGIVTQRFGIGDRRYAPARANEPAVLRGRLAGLRREGPVNPPCSAASTGMETRATIAVIAAIFFMMCSPFVLIWLLLRPAKLNDFLSGKKKF